MRVLSYLILIFWIAAFIRTILNLLLAPRLRPRVPRELPMVSILVPARDEERMIEKAVRGFLAQTYPALEVIVVNDRSTDATGEILRRIAAEDARLIVIDGAEPPERWLGKPWALHQAASRARGDLLLFVDADVLYSPGVVSAAVAEILDRDLPMLTLMPHIEMHGFWEHVAMPNLAVFGFSYISLWLANRSKIPALALGGGTGNFVRRSDYEAVGGHEALRAAVVDDMALGRLFRQKGRRTEVIVAKEMISVRMYHGLREIVHGFTKNLFAVTGRSYLLAAVFFLFGLVFHLLPYVLALTGDVISLAAVVLISLTRTILFTFLGYRLDNAILGHPLMNLVWGWIMLRSVWLTGIRRQLAWRGRTYDAKHTRFGAD